MNRLYNLDYLRGLAAFGIMVYHYLSWSYGTFSSETFLERLGIYGVSLFYVLSGLTLFHVYHEKMSITINNIIDFAKKRFFRIHPLLFLATIATLILTQQMPDLLKLLLNITGLFGYIAWDAYYATGAWSIGNELVFYTFFLFFLFFFKKSKVSLWVISLLIFCIYLYFAFNILDVNKALSVQWRDYVNPFNQLFLFLGGFLIGVVIKEVKISLQINLLLFVIGLSLFLYWPTSGDSIQLVTGYNRVIFTIASFLICISFYKTNIRFSKFIDVPLTFLGESSYSIYLLHPIVYTFAEYGATFSARYLFELPLIFKLFVALMVTILLSYFTYEYFEKYFIMMGSTKKLKVIDKVDDDASTEELPTPFTK